MALVIAPLMLAMAALMLAGVPSWWFLKSSRTRARTVERLTPAGW
jgi:hypothetical protein